MLCQYLAVNQALWLDAQHRHERHAVQEILGVGSNDAARGAGGLFLDGMSLISGRLSVCDLGWHGVLLE